MQDLDHADGNQGATESLVASIRDAVAAGPDEATTTARVADALKRGLDAGLEIPRSYTRPHPEHYAMYPLHVEPGGSFSIAVAVWGIGQRTPIHDHLTWGVVGVVSGSEREWHFSLAEQPPRVTEESVHGPGAVVVCCTSDADVHQVAAEGDEPCIALHVYGSDIGRTVRHVYDPVTGAASPFTSAWMGPTG